MGSPIIIQQLVRLKNKIPYYIILLPSAYNKLFLLKYEKVILIWSCIFKDYIWLNTVLKIQREAGSPIPCLINSNLKKVHGAKLKGLYVALLVNSWIGDV